MSKQKKIHMGTDGKPMSPWQIWLWRLCWIVLIWSILLLAIAIVLLIIGFFGNIENMMSWVLEDSTIDIHFFATMMGMTSFTGAILNLIVAILGIRGSENPKKIAPFFWIVIADATLTAWALAGSLSSGIFDPMSLLSGLFIIALAVLAWQVRKQTGYFDKQLDPKPTEGTEAE